MEILHFFHIFAANILTNKKMKKFFQLLTLLAIFFLPFKISAQDKQFSAYLSKAGMLPYVLSKEKAKYINELKLSGHMDARDFEYIKWYCKRVQTIDLAEVTIDAYSGEDGTNEGYDAAYYANEIPTGAFYYWGTSKNHRYSGTPKNEGMSSITKIILPKGTESIGSKAFADMPRLESITIMASNPPKVHESSFIRLPREARLSVPQGAKARYRSAEGWDEFREIVEVNENGLLLLTDSPLVGTWKTTEKEGWGQKLRTTETDFLQLNPDWTYIRVEEKDGEPYVTRGTWTITDNKFTLQKKYGEEDILFNYEIIEMTSNKMKVSMLHITEFLEKVKDSAITKFIKK